MSLPRGLRAAAVGFSVLAGVAAGQSCADLKQSCTAWAQRGECEGTGKAYMAMNCRASCKLCPESCVDDNPSCSGWAKLGECGRNPAWMHLHCRLSCGLCPPAPVLPDTTTAAPVTTPAPTPAPTTSAAPVTTLAATTVAPDTTTAAPDTTTAAPDTTTAAPDTTTTAAPDTTTAAPDTTTAAPVPTTAAATTTQAPTTSPAPPLATTLPAPVVPVVPEGTGKCGRYEAERFDTDLAGTMLAKTPAKSIDDCCGLCDGTAGCGGFSYTSGLCFLKGNLVGTFRSGGVRTRVKIVPGDCLGFTPTQSGVDITGSLVSGGSVFATHDGVCCDLCRKRADCQGFSYFPSQEKCYLKTGVNAAHPTYPQAGGQVRLRADTHGASGGRRLGAADVLV